MSIYANGHYYHVYNRGVDRCSIFKTDQNRCFFIQRAKAYQKGISLGLDVTLAAYCLMGNHYHLLLRQESDGGVSRYMQRLGTSYMMHWNRSSDWSGRLFQGPFRARRINTDAYLAHVVRYIHMNPVGKQVENAAVRGELESTIRDLVNYRWSDCAEYDIGRGVLSPLFAPQLYREFLAQWMRWPLEYDMLGASEYDKASPC